MPGAVYCGDMADVAALAFAGTDGERRGWLARRTADFGGPLEYAAGAVPYLWFVTTGIGAAWAGDAATADERAGRLAAQPGGTWREPAVAWLRALAAGVRGEPSADALLAAGELPGIASFQVLLRAQAASAAASERHPAAARARGEAEAAPLSLGAGGYAARLLPAAAAPAAAARWRRCPTASATS